MKMPLTIVQSHTVESYLAGYHFKSLNSCDFQKLGISTFVRSNLGNMFEFLGNMFEFLETRQPKGMTVLLKFKLAEEQIDDKLNLLPFNLKGFYNLATLSSLGFFNIDEGLPYLKNNQLEKHTKGLICLSGGFEGKLGLFIAQGNFTKAIEVAQYFSILFGKKNYYIEIQKSNSEEQKKINAELIKLAQNLKLPLVLTNRLYCLPDEQDDSSQKIYIKEDNNFLKLTPIMYEDYLEKVKLEFSHLPNAFENIHKIIQRTKFNLEPKVHLPKVALPNGFSSSQFLKKIAFENLYSLFIPLTENYLIRLTTELKCIKAEGLSDCFLIIMDLFQFAHKKNIPIKDGFSLCSGSLVGYVLGISDIDPIQNKLLFQIGQKNESLTVPFYYNFSTCQVRRNELINYLYQKYGIENVAPSISFYKYTPKKLLYEPNIRAGRDLRIINKLAPLVPDKRCITLAEFVRNNKALSEIYEQELSIQNYINDILDIEKHHQNYFHNTTYLVLSDQPIHMQIPLFKSKFGLSTQFDLPYYAWKHQCLTMQFTGIEHLSIVHKAIELINHKNNFQFSWSNISTNDLSTFQMLQNKNTDGIYLLGYKYTKEILAILKPDCLNDLIAYFSLDLPHLANKLPSDFGLKKLVAYIKVKNGLEKASYKHHYFKEILEETHGVLLFKEQVFRLANLMADFTEEETKCIIEFDLYCQPKIEAKTKKKFIDQAKIKGLGKKDAKIYYKELKNNQNLKSKENCISDAILAYRCAYLKCNYPQEFLSAQIFVENYQLNRGNI